MLVALRPDRMIYLMNHTDLTFYKDQNVDTLSGLMVLTRPLLLLEPLVTNAIGHMTAVDGKDTLLRTIFEKFGPKKISNPYQESEGIGTFGVGITPKVYSILGPDFSRYLGESEEGKEIAYWVPRRNDWAPERDLKISDSFSSFAFNDTKHVW
jgi:hypothetical protein